MSSGGISGVESKTLPLNQQTEEKPSKFKTLGFAVAIIFGIGGLAVASVGISGLLHRGFLTSLGQMNSIIMIATGGGGGIPLLIIGIVGFVKTRFGTKIDANLH